MVALFLKYKKYQKSLQEKGGQAILKAPNSNFQCSKLDGFEKIPRIVMPDLIRHPGNAEITG
jgi:hypothetical protein